MKDVLAFVMAGGRGERLMPLTRDRTKPAVPFGGIYRLIDFTLSNCVNSQIYRIIILPQYKSQSLNEHLEAGWNIFSHKIGHFLKIVPPQQRISSDWYRGTADAIRQNLNLIEQEVSPERWIDIPTEVLEVLNIWRPTPLVRALSLEKYLDFTGLNRLFREKVNFFK